MWIMATGQLWQVRERETEGTGHARSCCRPDNNNNDKSAHRLLEGVAVVHAEARRRAARKAARVLVERDGQHLHGRHGDEDGCHSVGFLSYSTTHTKGRRRYACCCCWLLRASALARACGASTAAAARLNSGAQERARGSTPRRMIPKKDETTARILPHRLLYHSVRWAAAAALVCRG